MEPVKKRRKTKPTLMQIKALQYINQGMSKQQAMLKAGYKKSVASHPKDNLMSKAGTKYLITTMGKELVDSGLATTYMVEKFKEWLSAQKIHTSHTEADRAVPDYDVQIKAFDRWKKIMDEQNGGVNGKVKRKLTIEEFVTGGEENG